MPDVATSGRGKEKSMAISLAPLTPHFGAKLTGVDIARPLTDAQFGEISHAFDEFSVLVLPNNR